MCVPVDQDETVDPRWGRARRVAVADVVDGAILTWQVYDVGWDEAHDQGAEGAHHARVARFLREHAVDTVVAANAGEGMRRMLASMGVSVLLGAEGDARAAVQAVESETT